MTEDEIRTFLKQLEAEFSGARGIIGESLLEVVDSENRNENAGGKYSGFHTLINSFLGFYYETLKSVGIYSVQNKLNSETLPLLMAMQFLAFRRFRSSYVLFLKGYPFDGSALLRGIFEIVLDLAALESGVLTLKELYGLETDTVGLSKREIIRMIRDKSNRNQNKIRANYLGEKSSLSKETQDEMHVWYYLLHKSVHKSFLEFASLCGPWLRGQGELLLLPNLDDKQAAFYMNRSTEIGWMLLRTFQLLKKQQIEFNSSWEEKWSLLDRSFRVAVLDLDKSISPAICEFIDNKLAWNC